MLAQGQRNNREFNMRFIKADGVPIVITIFAMLMGVGGTIIGINAIIDPSSALDFVDGADKMGTAWGGRNAGLGFAMLAAVALRSVGGYAVGLAGAIWREFSDLVAGLLDGGSLNIPFAVILVIEVVFLAICVRNSFAMRSEAAA